MSEGSVFYKSFPNQVTAVLPQTRKEYTMNITKSTLGALAFNGREKTYFDDSLKGFGVRDRIYAAVRRKRIFVCVRGAPSSKAQTHSLYFETEQRLKTVGVQPAGNRANALAPI